MAEPREKSVSSLAVAAQIRAERAALNLTQEEIWQRAGLSRSTYLRLERGKHVADTSELARLCDKVYGIPMSEFFQRVEARHPVKTVETAGAT